MESKYIEDLNLKQLFFTKISVIQTGILIPAYVILFGITESIIFYLGYNDFNMLKKLSFLFVGNERNYFLYLLIYLVFLYVAILCINKLAKDSAKASFIFLIFSMPPFYFAGFIMTMIDFSMLCLNDKALMSPGKDYMWDYLLCKGLVFLIVWNFWGSYGDYLYKHVKKTIAIKKWEQKSCDNYQI